MVISPCPILTGTCHVPVKAAKEEAAVKAVAQLHPVSVWTLNIRNRKAGQGRQPCPVKC